MIITWIGHSCFKIESDGKSIIIDPYEDGSVPGYKPVREKAGCVFSTHSHRDHSFMDGVVLSGEGLGYKAINAYHDDAKGEKRGPNRICIVDDGKERIAHLGDLGEYIESDELHCLDVLLIPVGGFYTIDGKEAARIVRKLNPRLVIPMHFRSDKYGFGYDEISTLDDFVSEFSSVRYLDSSTMDTKADYGAGIIVLRPRNLA